MDLSQANTRDKSKIKCFKCRGFGHYQRDCPVKINELQQEAIQEILQMHFEASPPEESKPEEPTIEIYSSSGQVEVEENPEEDTRQNYSYSSWSTKDRYANLYSDDDQSFH